MEAKDSGFEDATRPNGMKVLVVGPSASGKTIISNFLAGNEEQEALKPPTNYNETKGVR